MSEVIQGPWKKRTPHQDIEHDILMLADSLAKGLSVEPARWPPARAAIHAVPSLNREPQR